MTFNFNVEGITPKDTVITENTGTIPPAPSEETESLSPLKMRGLCFWLDGQCNTRNGTDKSKKYMENLVYNTPKTPTVGTSEYLNIGSGNSWNGDFLKLGNFAFYPYCVYPQATIEAVVKVDKELSNSLMICGIAYLGGYQFAINSERKCYFQARENSAYTSLFSDTILDLNKTYYIVVSLDEKKQMAVYVKNTNEKSTKPFGTLQYSSQSAQMGLGTLSNIVNNVNKEYWDGLQVGMVRIWRRVLSDEEIETNYQDARKRFKF